MLFALPYPLYPLEIQVGNETVPQLCREVDRNEIDCEEQTTAAANRFVKCPSYSLELILNATVVKQFC